MQYNALVIIIYSVFISGQVLAQIPARCVKRASANICNPKSADLSFLPDLSKALSASGSKIEAVVSDPLNNIYLQPIKLHASESSQFQSNRTAIDLGAGSTCQTIKGYGFTMTESTVENLKRLPKGQRKLALQALFSPEKAAMNYVVLPLSSSDFNISSRGDFSVCDCNHQKPNPQGTCFSPERLEETISVLREAQSINPKLRLMLKPWTPPMYMKVPDNKGQTYYAGGKFDAKWSASLGRCLAKATQYVQEKGLKVQSVAAQNEPGLSLPYPSVIIDDVAHAKVLDTLNQKLKKVSPSTQIVIRADNFISASGAKKTLQSMKTEVQNPVFFAHCYSNDPKASQALLPKGMERFCSERLPKNLEYAMGECTGSKQPNYKDDFQWWMTNRVIGDTDMGAGAVMSWNGVLDESYGPKNGNGGCQACRGLLTTDFSKEPAKVIENPEFLALQHLSRYVQPGAVRILSPSSASSSSNLVFKNPDNSYVVVLQNNQNKETSLNLYTVDCKEIPLNLPAQGTVTVRIGG